MTPAARMLSSRAVRVGIAVGIGVTARAIAARLARRSTSGLVDWERAEGMAVRRLRTAPGHLSAAEIAKAAPSYERAMARVVPVLEARLGTALPGVVERHSVVDRAAWARANMVTFRSLIDHIEPSFRPRGAPSTMRTDFAAAANRVLTTSQIGFLLGYLGSRVLGQYDVALLSAEHEPGRLLYVEENIRMTARAIGARIEDFRVWVCLHETTHAFEMEAHPWVRPYLRERLERQLMLFADETRRLQEHGLRHLTRRWRTVAAEGSLSGFLSPEQRRLMKETQLVMSLMEGFSDWVMDEVGTSLMPDVRTIRRRFEQRRSQRRRTIDRIVARLTGLDLKLEQYRRGERFVSGVHAAGGDAAVARLWDGPETLPTEDELADPRTWVRRVMGTA
jgi:coenzyme F420 biosynthesis associated uncharacterized protein